MLQHTENPARGVSRRDLRGPSRWHRRAACIGSRRQRGWIGLLGLLLALVIVGLLAQKVLKSYGLMPGAEPEAKSSAERAPRGPGPASAAPPDATIVTPAPTAAIERARGLENAVQQQANEINKRMDETAK